MSYTIKIEWSTDDIHAMGYNLTEEQAIQVLNIAEDEHDSNIGLNWDVFEDIIDKLYKQ